MRKAILQRKLNAQTVHTGQKTRETLNLIEGATVVLNVTFVRNDGKGFIYNTQKKRHLLKNACKHAKK